MKTNYTNLYEITVLQQKIMRYMDYQAHIIKSAIPRSKIIKEFESQGEKTQTIGVSLNQLIKLNYIRRANTISNKTYYVMLRRI